MKGFLLLLGLLVAVSAARADDDPPPDILSEVMLGGQIGRSVRVFAPLRESAPSETSYLVPRFGVYVGTTRVTDSSPDSVLARLFAKAGLGTTARAMTITVQFNDLPEMPLIVVERSSNKYKQFSVVNVGTVPSLQYPGEGRRMTIRYRYATNYDTSVATNLMKFAGIVSTVVTGAPIGFITTEVTSAGYEIDKILRSTFSVEQEYTFEIGLSQTLSRWVRQLEIVYYDRPTSDTNAEAMATVVANLEIARSLFKDPDDNGKFANADESAVLNKVLGKKSVYDYLKEQTNAFVVMRAPGATTEQYVAGCEAVRDPIYRLGLTGADNALVFWSALASATKPAPNACPQLAERNRMRALGLPALPGEAADDHAIFEPGLNTLREIFKDGRSFADLTSEVITFQQNVELLPDVPVGSEQYFRPAVLDQKFAKLRATTFGEWTAHGQSKGDYTVNKFAIAGKSYELRVRFTVQVVSSGPPEVRRVRLERLLVQPAGW